MRSRSDTDNSPRSFLRRAIINASVGNRKQIFTFNFSCVQFIENLCYGRKISHATESF